MWIYRGERQNIEREISIATRYDDQGHSCGDTGEAHSLEEFFLGN